MAIHSGKFGAINGQRSISQWQISKNLASTPFTLSNTKGARGPSNGIKKWSGSCQQMLGEPTVLPGATFSFIGYQAPDNDISRAGAGGYSGTAMVQQVQINWDWRSGNPLSSNITFLGDGALTGPATQTITDTGQVDILSVCACKIESSTNGSVWTELADVASAQLTLTSEVLSYVNSSTQCWRKRKAGIKDWSASIVIDTVEGPCLEVSLFFCLGQPFVKQIGDRACHVVVINQTNIYAESVFAEKHDRHWAIWLFEQTRSASAFFLIPDNRTLAYPICDKG